MNRFSKEQREILYRVGSHMDYSGGYDQGTYLSIPDKHIPKRDIGVSGDEAIPLVTKKEEPLCGTKACVAGWIAWELGWVPVWARFSEDEYYSPGVWLRKDGELRDPDDALEIAAEYLSLTETEASLLFGGWEPHPDYTPGGAIQAFADGYSLIEITSALSLKADDIVAADIR
jgi:hypothetical protein